MTQRSGDIWVFGYGSLMWRPGFEHEAAAPALLRGYHRAFCVWSHRYRGTREAPGLVLGLDRGGACRGVAFRVAARKAETVLAYLHEREMITNVYRRLRLPVALADARRVEAYAFVCDRDHSQYAGRLSPEEIARIIAQGCGTMGSNLDYLANTVSHLETLGIRESDLHALLELARAHCAGTPA